jgi:hypothetical protein
MPAPLNLVVPSAQVRDGHARGDRRGQGLTGSSRCKSY